MTAVFRICLFIWCLWASCSARPLRYPNLLYSPSRDNRLPSRYYNYNADRDTPSVRYYSYERDQPPYYYYSNRHDLKDSGRDIWNPTPYYGGYDDFYDRDEYESDDMATTEVDDAALEQLYTELARIREQQEAHAAMKYDVSDDLTSEQRLLNMLLDGQRLDQTGDLWSDGDTISDMVDGFEDEPDEVDIPENLSRKKFHQQLEMLPIEISQLDKVSTDTESKNPTYLDKQEASSTEEINPSLSVSRGVELSKDKARQLLSVLQKAEKQRAQEETPTLSLDDSDKDVLRNLMEPLTNQGGGEKVEEEADVLKLKEILGETSSEEKGQPSVDKEVLDVDEQDLSTVEDEMDEDTDSEDLEISLLKNENNLILDALRYAIDAPPDDMRSMAKMRELVNQAAAEQEAINYLESTRDGPVELSMD